MRLMAVCGLLVLASAVVAGPALAQPAPAGSCRLDEGLVAQMSPSAPPNSRAFETGDPAAPHVIAMPLPKLGTAILDVAFHIEDDGQVTQLKVLCVSSADDALRVAVEKASKNWKFAAMKRGGKAVASDASYRISAAGAVPLSFAPEKLRPIQG